MKTFLSLILILSFLNADATLIANINKTLQKVMQESTNKDLADIKVSYDPFNTNRPKTVTKQEKKLNNLKQPQALKHSSKLELSMIFNKKAFINGKWYKENEKLADYKIMKINQDIVVLKKNSKYTTLKLPLSDMILVTKEEIQ